MIYLKVTKINYLTKMYIVINQYKLIFLNFHALFAECFCWIKKTPISNNFIFLEVGIIKISFHCKLCKIQSQIHAKKTTSYQQKDFFSHLKNDKNRKLLLQDDSLQRNKPCYGLATLVNKTNKTTDDFIKSRIFQRKLRSLQEE